MDTTAADALDKLSKSLPPIWHGQPALKAALVALRAQPQAPASGMGKGHEPPIDALERTADRLTGRGITGLISDDWPVLVAALEDYIAIRRGVADWDSKIQAAAQSVAALSTSTSVL